MRSLEGDQPLSGLGRLWRSALFKALEERSTLPIEALRLSLAYPTLDFRLDDRSLTPLILACIAKSPWLAQALVRMGADPDFPDDSGWTPLHWACKIDIPSVADALLSAGANPNARRVGEQASGLHFCAQSGAYACARLLLAHGADASYREPETQASARHWSAHDVEMSMLLGPGVPGVDGLGRSILHWAARGARDDRQAIDACSHWVEQGASVLASDHRGWLPVHAARSRSLWGCAHYLESVAERGALQETAQGPHGSSARRI